MLIDPKGSDYSRYSGATVITPNRAELQQVVGSWQDDGRTAGQGAESARDARTRRLAGDAGRGRHDAVRRAGRSACAGPGARGVRRDRRGRHRDRHAGRTGRRGLGLREAMPLANKAGGIVVGKFGTATVSYEELFA